MNERTNERTNERMNQSINQTVDNKTELFDLTHSFKCSIFLDYLIILECMIHPNTIVGCKFQHPPSQYIYKN